MTIREYFETKQAGIKSYSDVMEYNGELYTALEMYSDFNMSDLIEWAIENNIDLTATDRNGNLILDKWAEKQ